MKTKRQCGRPVGKLASSRELSLFPDITQNKLQEDWTQTEETFRNVKPPFQKIAEANVGLQRKYARNSSIYKT